MCEKLKTFGVDNSSISLPLIVLLDPLKVTSENFFLFLSRARHLKGG